ncbi:hypothetical protein I4F81_010529 [Pyropia yezoensis]|uniref:Uncharacterized protein n=1 Tax=Pyropia yezoensis TaxID=2788 RepID=A0ACC3CE26_PYRYE|nr:hypothetical protein I4F81_010529 [Neopyropia yezoensis]
MDILILVAPRQERYPGYDGVFRAATSRLGDVPSCIHNRLSWGVVSGDGLLHAAGHKAADDAAAAAADPATAKMMEELKQEHLQLMPPLPVGHLFDRHPGYFTVHAGKGLASGRLLLEVPKAKMDTPFMVLAMFTAGNAEAGLSGVPANTVERTVFAFRKTRGRPDTLDLYRPLMDLRAEKADSQMAASLREGYFPGWVRTFPVRSIGDSYLLDATPWVGGGMDVVTDNDGRPPPRAWEQAHRLVNATAYPRNVELDVQMKQRSLNTLGGSVLSPENTFSSQVRYSIVALPDKPMATRAADSRVGFFGTSFISADAVDGGRLKRTIVNRWNLANSSIVFYVHPTVPDEYRPTVKRGVEEWKKAFARAGHPGAIRAVLPGDKDWPADYSLGDVRYSSIAWAPNLRWAWAMGPRDVDPRTGEILRGSVMLAANNVQQAASRAHLSLLPLAVEALAGDVSRWSMASDEVQMRALSLRMLATLAAAEADEVDAVSRPAVGVKEDTAVARKMPEVGAPAAGVIAAVIEQDLKQLVMHEVGHVLGLRHNFKASASIPFAKLSDKAWVEANGTSSSVMDYLPVIVRKNPADQVVYASPTIGAYDYSAIRYGYGDFKSDDARLAFAQSVAMTTPFATDTDGPGFHGADPLTSYWDLSDSPLDYHAESVAVTRKVLRTSKAFTIKTAGSQWLDFSDVARDAMLSAVFSLEYVAKFIGGVVPSRAASTGSPSSLSSSSSSAFTLVDVATEKRALSMILRELHPLNGLLGSATVREYGAHMVSRECWSHVGLELPTEQCLGVQAAPLVTALRLFRRLAQWVGMLIDAVRGNTTKEHHPLAVTAVVGELSRIHGMVATGAAKDPHLRGLSVLTSAYAG